MSSNILVSAAELEALIDDDRCVTADCRFDFADTSRGRSDWLAAWSFPALSPPAWCKS